MKKILPTIFSIIILASSCSNDQRLNDNIDLDNLDLSELTIGLNKDIIVNLNLSNTKEVNNFVSSLLDETDELVKGDEKKMITFQLIVNSNNNNITITNFKEVVLSENLEYRGDPIEDIMGSCPEGWNDEGNCSSEACVRRKITSVLSEIDGAGDCRRIQVSRGYISAKVCSQQC